MAAICPVDERLEGRICLQGHHLPRVKFFEGEYAGLEEDAYGISNDLFIRVREIANALDFLTLLDSVEEHFGQIAGRHGTAEQRVIGIQCHHVWLAI
jgi:hypothetical protein